MERAVPEKVYCSAEVYFERRSLQHGMAALEVYCGAEVYFLPGMAVTMKLADYCTEVYFDAELRSISEISCFFGSRPWHIEIRHRVKKTSSINLLGFETLKLKIRRLKLWKPTVRRREALQTIVLSVSSALTYKSEVPQLIFIHIHQLFRIPYTLC